MESVVTVRTTVAILVIDDDHCYTQSDPGRIYTQNNTNNGSSGPFSDTSCGVEVRSANFCLQFSSTGMEIPGSLSENNSTPGR